MIETDAEFEKRVEELENLMEKVNKDVHVNYEVVYKLSTAIKAYREENE